MGEGDFGQEVALCIISVSSARHFRSSEVVVLVAGRFGVVELDKQVSATVSITDLEGNGHQSLVGIEVHCA